MKMSEAFPSKYLKAADLDGQKRVLTIVEVKPEMMGQGDEQEVKPVVYFHEEEKGLVLNVTNGRAISGMYGDESDHWRGQRVTLFSTWVEAFGKHHEAIRVEPRPPAPVPQAPQPAPAAPPPPPTPPPADDVPF